MTHLTIPTVAGHWLLGHARPMQKEAHSYVADLCRQHGDLVSFRVLNRRLVATNNAAYARHWLVTHHERYGRTFPMHNGALVLGGGLLTSDGEHWLRHRRMLLPPFRPGQLEPLVAATQEATLALLDRWDALQRRGEPIAIPQEMRRLALDVISRMLFSEPMDPTTADWFNALVTRALQLIFRRNYHPYPLPFWLPTPDHNRLRGIKSHLDRYLLERIAARVAPPPDEPRDLLDAMRAARDPESGAPLSPEDLLAEVKTMFVAGFETTATALSWALYLLAGHPDEDAAWADELNTVLAERPPTWEDVPRLKYLNSVVLETLRLYPPVFAAVRQALADDEMAGYVLREGTLCLVSIFGIHRSSAYWPEPERFRPARFAAGDWPKEAFLPFLTGKHVCIGNHFSLLEMTVALALMGQRYRFERVDDQPLGMRPQITLVPDRELYLRLVPRL
ncbi:MAG: cytochrome P450 [Candidatus Competibacteraceae bacterium]|jgi:cytochrome P450|nr:cytochrome P450 [Candidatus Competibacteraceae bacterium]